MRKTALILLPLFPLLWAAPAAAAPPAAAPPATATEKAGAAPPKQTAPGRFGAKLSDKPAVPVSAVLKAPKSFDGKDLKLTGQVGAVCAKKGCWMTIGTGEPGAKTVRISFKDYGFFVPTDSLGKEATVEGHLEVKVIPQKEAQHYADDAQKEGAPRKIVAGDERTLALVATGVELR